MINFNNNEEQMLHDISILSFTLTDLMEYLDTHPYDKQALSYFNHYNRICNEMTKDFSERYYPLHMNLSNDSNEWAWGKAPLPWQNKNEDSAFSMQNPCKGGNK